MAIVPILPKPIHSFVETNYPFAQSDGFCKTPEHLFLPQSSRFHFFRCVKLGQLCITLPSRSRKETFNPSHRDDGDVTSFSEFHLEIAVSQYSEMS